MVITKVREYLGVGLALLAAIACGYGVVNHFRLEATQASLDQSLTNNAKLVGVNEQNNETINELVEQRKIDDKLVTLLNEQYDKLASDSQIVRERLDEIRENDKEFKELLGKRHPISVSKLLNSRAGSNADRNGEATASQ